MVSLSIMTYECPRLKYLLFKGVKGVSQYRKERDAVLREYCVAVFMGMPIPPNARPFRPARIEADAVEMGLDSNLETLRQTVTIQKKVTDGDESAYLGELEGDPALFTITFSKRVSEYHPYILMTIKDSVFSETQLRLATIMVAEGRVKEFPMHGMMTKSGVADKRDKIGSWENIRKTITEVRKKFEEEIVRAVGIPPPRAGECGICPYHNAEVEVDGVSCLCNG